MAGLDAARRAGPGRWQVSPETFRRLATGAAITLALVVVTGGAVRLTGSGLGCPTWPRCTANSYVAPASYHALVEFTNRMISVAVGVFIGAVALASLLRKPRRRDLVWLSWSLVAGFLGQAVIGGLAVLYHLAPGWVMAHFLLSMVIVWAAVVLHHRSHPAWRPGGAPAVRREVRWLGQLLAGSAGLVLILGTVVTGAGPHAGAPNAPRLHLPLARVTQLHADSALFLTGALVATLIALRIADAPAPVRRRANVAAGLLLLQVAIGYTQYFLDLPPGLIEMHIACATALWMALIRLNLSMSSPLPAPSTAQAAPEGVPAQARG
ncbi:MAG: COX15/CtaA family protein [Mycobacteriales bacterium]